MAQMVSLFQNLGENKMDKKDLRSLTLEQLQIELENMAKSLLEQNRFLAGYIQDR